MNTTTNKRSHPPGGYATQEPVESVMTDKGGNNMFAINNGRTIELYAQLRGDSERRYIGTVDLGMHILTVKRKRAVHEHRKTKSYGFNYHVVHTGKTFDRVQIIDDFGTYMVPLTVIIHEGKVLNFTQSGFEKQIFLPISVIEMHRTKHMI